MEILFNNKANSSMLSAGKSVARELLIVQTVLIMREGHGNPELLISLVENMKNH